MGGTESHQTRDADQGRSVDGREGLAAFGGPS